MRIINSHYRIIKQIINNFFEQKPLNELGRWKIEYCKNKIDRKIDLANIDNCGSCTLNN